MMANAEIAQMKKRDAEQYDGIITQFLFPLLLGAFTRENYRPELLADYEESKAQFDEIKQWDIEDDQQALQLLEAVLKTANDFSKLCQQKISTIDVIADDELRSEIKTIFHKQDGKCNYIEFLAVSAELLDILHSANGRLEEKRFICAFINFHIELGDLLVLFVNLLEEEISAFIYRNIFDLEDLLEDINKSENEIITYYYKFHAFDCNDNGLADRDIYLDKGFLEGFKKPKNIFSVLADKLKPKSLGDKIEEMENELEKEKRITELELQLQAEKRMRNKYKKMALGDEE